MPHFVSPGQLRRVKRAVACLSAVLDRFCDAYAEDERLREELAVPAAEDALIRLDPGFSRPLKICRLDAFLQGYDVKFLEFNADSPAGIGYTDVLYEGLQRAISLPRVSAEFETSYTPMLPVLVDTLMSAYRELRGERARPAGDAAPGARGRGRAAPRCPSSGSSARRRSEPGSRRSTGRSTRSRYDGSLLRVQGEPVHLVYRRALLEDLPEGDLIAAARDRRAAVVNPFRARVANNKKLFALLGDPRFAHLVEDAERQVIAETIPWTRVLREGRADYGDWVVDLLAFVSDNRERLVMKPASDYGGHGVSLGMETEQARVGPADRGARRARATTWSRSTCRCPRRCSRPSRTGTSRCASSASTSTRSAWAGATRG